jgi:rsbT antagonist protein RsbS
LTNVESSIVLQPVGGLVVIPLRDPIYHEVMADLSNRVLEHLHRDRARGIIFDMSGVEVLDEQDFEDLRRIAQGAALMGAPVVFAEIRPGVAAGLTMLNVDETWVRAARTVDQALELFA